MSAEYAVKMELLRRNREELTAKRQEIERRIALREATAAEYSAVALQSCKQRWKTLRANAIAAKKRNDEFIRELQEAQRKIDEIYVRTTQKLWPSDNQLEVEKARYLRKVEELYPAWQEKVQVMRIQALRELEAKKRAIEQRRFLAKKTFETERTLEDLIRRTTHEIELAENLEKNEAFERDVLRNQGEIQAMRIDESIRDHALGARIYMKQQAETHLDEAQHLQPDVEDKIFETFSPRGAVKAMKQSNRSVVLVDTADKNVEERDIRLPRAQSIRVPEPQYNHEEVEQKSQHVESFANVTTTVTKSVPVERPANDANAWARSELRPAERFFLAPSALTNADDTAALVSMIHPINPHPKEPSLNCGEVMDGHAVSAAPSSSDTTWPLEEQTPSKCFQERTVSASCAPTLPPSQLATIYPLSHPGHLSIKRQALSHKPTHSPSYQQGFSLAAEETKESSTFDRSPEQHNTEALREDSSILYLHDSQLGSQSPTTEIGLSNEFERAVSPHKDKPTHINSKPDAHLSHPWQNQGEREEKTSRTENRLETDAPSSCIESLNVVAEPKAPVVMELTPQDKVIEPIAEEEEEVQLLGSFNAYLINSPPLQPEENVNQPAAYQDLTLDFNSFDSNQSSMMDFSIGKLLEPSLKAETVEDSRQNGSTPAGGEDATFTTLNLSTSLDSFALESPDRVIFTPESAVDRGTGHSTIRDLKEATQTQLTQLTRDKTIECSSVDSMSGFGSPAARVEDAIVDSASDIGSPSPKHAPESHHQSIPAANEDLEAKAESPPLSPAGGVHETSIFAMLSMSDRFKALSALISRVEEGINDGDQISCGVESGSSYETKRELLRMAVSSRKAQINFFGADVCFELVVELARDLGQVLFPAKAFEGIMNEQKMKKVHQNAKEKEFDMWRAFAAHIKQVYAAKAVPAGPLADLFTSAFLSHDPTNQRSQRKLREFLLSICGTTDATPKKDATPSSPRQASSPPVESISPANSTEVPPSPQIPSLLQTAFLQQSSPVKPKVYGIASSGFKKKSNSDDVLKSMASSPTKLSQKLIRGGKMGDYSEFEEEEEVNLENLIGRKAPSASAASKTTSAFRGGGGSSMARMGTTLEDKVDFDVDF